MNPSQLVEEYIKMLERDSRDNPESKDDNDNVVEHLIYILKRLELQNREGKK